MRTCQQTQVIQDVAVAHYSGGRATFSDEPKLLKGDYKGTMIWLSRDTRSLDYDSDRVLSLVLEIRL